MKIEITATEGAAPSFAAEVEQESGERPLDCYQCGKCTAGCPMTFAMDLDPARVMRLVQLGQREAVLQSHTIWLCASCETCSTRCPQEVDLARVMDALRILARRAGFTSAEREVAVLNQSFLDNVKSRGRVHETALVIQQKLKTLHLFQDVDKGPLLLSRGKLALGGHKAANLEEVRRVFENVAKREGSKE
jgi:heterodisulfide reductase subunit C